jgi:hypothetical protein
MGCQRDLRHNGWEVRHRGSLDAGWTPAVEPETS